MVAGNYIGPVAGGGAAVFPNALNGVLIDGGASGNTIGGTSPAARNIISGNLTNGVRIAAATANVVSGNFIGAGKKGLGAVPNGRNGVLLDSAATSNTIGGSTVGARNIIVGNLHDGVLIFGGLGTSVAGNSIGAGLTGLAIGNHANGVEIASGSIQNTVGGVTSTIGQGLGNLISANTGDGVLVTGATTARNKVQGNAIGTDASGTRGMGNLDNGVELSGGSSASTIGGTAAHTANLISSNGFNSATGKRSPAAASPTGGNGILINHSNKNLIAGNRIGVSLSGLKSLANANKGIQSLSGSNNTIINSAAVAVSVVSGSGKPQANAAAYHVDIRLGSHPRPPFFKSV